MVADPDELNNVINVPIYRERVSAMRREMYRQLVERGDKFAQWLAFAGDIPADERVRPVTAVERFITQ
jgi:hypothetical protein